MKIAAEIVVLATLIGGPIAMIFTAGTASQFAILAGCGLVGGGAKMLAEYFTHPR